MKCVEHPLVKPETVEWRLYQETIVASASQANTLVVAPTALGKTVIAILLAAHRLHKFPDSKVLMLAPTKPLARQHAQSFLKFLRLTEDEVEVFTGSKSPKERAELWKYKKVICATPQVVHNDLVSGTCSLRDVSLLVFDEAHRATGNYPYGFIAERYMAEAENPLILGLTASPGGDEERIREVIDNLFIENIEVRTESDSDVKPYIKGIKVEWVKVEMPDSLKAVKSALESVMKKKIAELREMGISINQDATKKDLLMLRGMLQTRLAEERSSEIFTALSLVAALINITHALELLETQGLKTLAEFFYRMEKNTSSKAVKELLKDTQFLRAVRLTQNLAEEVENPKLKKIKDILSGFKGKAIVFTQYRDTASMLVEELNKIPGIVAERFVGQASRGNEKGLTQREQIAVIDRFRSGEINVLVATSVAEEGLDIPRVDLVIFYEPIPSEIRSIQRRGRTGRHELGRVIVLVTKNTRDEAFLWASRRRERKMREVLEKLKRERAELRRKQTTLEMHKTGISIYLDTRELSSSVVRELLKFGIICKPRMLEVGDYVISNRVVVERKTCEDFVDSIIDGRLFSQAVALKRSYEKPVIVVEGENLYSARGVTPQAITGALLSLAVDFGIPVLFSKNEKETALIISSLARREQTIEGREVRIRGEKKLTSLKEMQEFIVAGLPNINTTLARRLLEHFGSVERVFTASEKELEEVQGIGRKTAREIRRILTAKY